MGCLFAAYFEAAGHDVVVLDHHEERAGRLSEAGISVSGVCGEVHARPVVTADASRHGPFDFLMLWVKAYSTRTALRQHAAAVGEKTVIFSAQNGIGNIETIAELFPRNPIVGGITTEGAFLEGEGRVRHAGRGKTVVGAANPPAQPHLADVCSMLQAAKLDCEETNDIYTLIWKKLAVNSCINPLTAILGVPNGRLLELPGFSQLARSVVEELVLAASARNIT
ncbi:MAG: 2-dehydropantoate 2-reductase, partial [Deltaproteobacteria bacterium]